MILRPAHAVDNDGLPAEYRSLYAAMLLQALHEPDVDWLFDLRKPGRGQELRVSFPFVCDLFHLVPRAVRREVPHVIEGELRKQPHWKRRRRLREALARARYLLRLEAAP